ncbi:TonB-dependent receptor plug domain-containing protein [Eikenella corrodens]|uniref:TonB-dependent receptor plug domain-containing protein n=1 Tax=Eikenella corrodens TaxID=539 RepID=UPI0026BA0399
MKTHIHQHRPSILFLALCSIFSAPVWAAGETGDAGSAQLETIEIQGRRHAPRQLGRERIRREQLDKEMVQDIRDMVRYDPGISVAEGGRAGSNGFSIRGVDKDRVAIVVDGLDQGESRSSSAFQELFGAYGNFNTNRNAAELEHMSEVTISKGADSITAGSGALGGAVIYRTKSPRDYVDEDKPYYVGMKTGYLSRSEQWLASITAAGRLGGFDALWWALCVTGMRLKTTAKPKM